MHHQRYAVERLSQTALSNGSLKRLSRHTHTTAQYAAPLRVALQRPSKTLELDVNDPALWTHPQVTAL